MRLSRYPHLAASGLAFLVLALGVQGGTGLARWLEVRALHRVAPRTFELKNRGIVLQREAFRHDDLLPLYGSSELMKRVPDKAGDFFRNEPTGFEVFPVGKAGATSLVILQKLAAVGPELRGRKVAISLSPSWFVQTNVEPHHYAGNFSLEQASALAFSPTLDRGLKRDIARRLLEFPSTLEKSPVLMFALRRLAGDSAEDRVLYRLVWPAGWMEGWMEGWMLRTQDHFHTLAFLEHHWRHWRFHPHRHDMLPWPRLLAQAEAWPPPRSSRTRRHAAARAHASGEAEYLRRLAASREWHDLALLLRGLQQMGAKPLLLSMPLNGNYLETARISASARATYYEKMEAVAASFGVALADFRDHDNDPEFLADTHDHLSAKGWLYFDAAMDAFYHGRPLPTVLQRQASR